MSEGIVVLDLASAPAPAEHVYAREVGDECVALDERTGELHVLNAPATMVWRCLDGRSTLGDIAEDIAVVTGADIDQVRRDVLDLAEQLHASGLLTGSALPVMPDHRDAPPPNT